MKLEVDEYVKNRLLAWADWYIRGCDNGLGYPKKNIIARLREEGFNLIKPTGFKLLPTNIEAEEIEELICKLAVLIPKHAEVVRICYFFPGKAERMANNYGYKTSQYYAHLRLAHEWIKGYLSARKKMKNNNIFAN